MYTYVYHHILYYNNKYKQAYTIHIIIKYILINTQCHYTSIHNTKCIINLYIWIINYFGLQSRSKFCRNQNKMDSISYFGELGKEELWILLFEP